MTGKELLDWLRRKPKPTPEELAKQAARQSAIERCAADSKRYADLMKQGYRGPSPVLQNYLDDPNYKWVPITPPKPTPPRPI